MSVKNIVQAVPIASISSATLSGSFQPINTGGLPQACFYVRINNASDENVLISFDGTNTHDVVLMNDKLDLMVQQNAQPPTYVAQFAKGTVVYAKGTAGTGTIYVSGYYQPQGG